MTNTPFCLFPQGHPLAKTLSGFNRGMPGGVSLLSGRHPRLQCAWISSGTAPEREARTNDCVPFVQYPTYDRSHHQSPSAHSIVGTSDQTSAHAVLKLSGVAAALVNPPLLGPLSHNYASLVVCLDLLWCIRVRIYTREW